MIQNKCFTGMSYYYSQCFKWGSKRQKSCTGSVSEREFQSCFSKTICLNKIQFCLEKFLNIFKLKLCFTFWSQSTLYTYPFCHFTEGSWFCLVLLRSSEQSLISEQKCGAFVFVLPVPAQWQFGSGFLIDIW